ncbi:MAG: 50S ribosomal protein L25/general stress protein Ctc [Candidatus Competibacterales bacterium]
MESTVSQSYSLNAWPRDEVGKGASRRLRRRGLVPAVIYGGDKPPQSITIEQREIVRNLKEEGFYSHVIELQLDGQVESVILRDLQRHPFKPLVDHADFQRIRAGEQMRVSLAFHFLNQETAVGVKQQGGRVSHHLIEAEVLCTPQALPDFIPVDIPELEVGQTLHLSQIPLPEGVVFVELANHANDLAVVSVQGKGGPKANQDSDEAA